MVDRNFVRQHSDTGQTGFQDRLPQGLDRALREAADLAISFGAQTWPHQLVRVMLAEQLYRVSTILSGHPYHRS